MRRPLICAAILLLFLTSSCGALLSRSVVIRTTDPQPLFFMGVGYDALIIADNLGHGGSPWYLRVLAAVDLPLSLGMDILLLPFDTGAWFLWTADAASVPEDSDADASTHSDRSP